MEIMAKQEATRDSFYDSWKQVAAEYLSSAYSIPGTAIPALVAKCVPVRQDWDRVGTEWQTGELARVDKERREKYGLPPWPEPTPLTVTSIREEIRRLRDEWAGETDGGFERLVSIWAIERLWRKAGQVPGAPPPPPWPGSTNMPLRNRQDAITAANVLLGWCGQPEALANPKAPAEPQVATVEPQAPPFSSRRIHVDGKLCQIAFDGNNFTLTEQGGAIYLAELLLHPDSPDSPARYSPWELERLKGLPTDRQAGVEAEAVREASGQWEMTDSQTVTAVKKFISETEEAIAEARKAGDLGQIDELDDNLTRAKQYLEQTTFAGQIKVESDAQAAQDRVSAAIRRIRKALRDNGATGENLAEYLKTRVVCQDGQFFFSPSPGDTPWQS
jgi:hypothetical protein